jgi:hypothetical protein
MEHTLSASHLTAQWDAAVKPRERFRRECQAQPHAAAWLTAQPCEALGLLFAPADFQLLCRRWLGVNLFPSLEAALCPACGSQGDVQGDHVLCCAQLGRYARHTALRETLLRIAEAAGYSCQTEVRVDPASQRRPADFLITGFDHGVDLAVDVSGVHPLQLRSDFTQDCGAVAERREQQKVQQSAAFCHAQGVRFTPVVGETTGGWGPLSHAFLRRLFRAYRSRHPSASAEEGTSALWCRVSVGFAKAVGRQLASAVVLEDLDL